MKYAVVGSRILTNKELIFDTLKKYDISFIVSGGASGVDSIAEEYAKINNIKTKIYLPDWNRYGKSAGMIRNKDIIKNSEITIAFWDGKSKGTLNSIEYSKKLKHPTELWIIRGDKIYKESRLQFDTLDILFQ